MGTYSFTFVTLFPEYIQPFFENAIIQRALQAELLTVKVVPLRQYGEGRYRKCDDVPYGGGGGMLMTPIPLARALEQINIEHKCVIYPTPSGVPYTKQHTALLDTQHDFVFICGHYEGIDQRIIDVYVDYEFSIGNYVISSGELASLVIFENLARSINGVISAESLKVESFVDDMLEHPHYTRPAEWNGRTVPDVLLSGDHRAIDVWREQQRTKKTAQRRTQESSGTAKP